MLSLVVQKSGRGLVEFATCNGLPGLSDIRGNPAAISLRLLAVLLRLFALYLLSLLLKTGHILCRGTSVLVTSVLVLFVLQVMEPSEGGGRGIGAGVLVCVV